VFFNTKGGNMEIPWMSQEGESVILTDKTPYIRIKKVVTRVVLDEIARQRFGANNLQEWKNRVLATVPEGSQLNRVQTFFVPILIRALAQLTPAARTIEEPSNILYTNFY